jgi:outer membrane protein OmpA-like peptidoglycan-associated protein
MSSQTKSQAGQVFLTLSAVLAILCGLITVAAAQDQTPKWELFGGYSLFHSGADINGQLPNGLFPVTSRLEVNPRGVGLAATYDFNRWFGMTLDSSAHWGSGERTTFERIDDTGFYNLSVGPKVTFRGKHFSPFLEFLVGDHRLTPDAFHDVDTLGFMPGGGLDIVLSRHIALRLIRADYVYSNYRYGPKDTTAETQIRGARLQTGINFMFGGSEDVIPLSAACTSDPTEVFAGETVTVTAIGSNFNPKSALRYSWEGAEAKVTGNEASTRVNTTGLSAGPYTAIANVSDDHKHSASCTSRFMVKQPLPPIISCAADPASVPVGGTSTITSTATSPRGRNLTYSYSASAGEVSGTTSSATLNTVGVQPGQIRVTCNATDQGTAPLNASSSTVVSVKAPPPPAPEIAQLEAKLALHSIYFQTARPTVDMPNGGLVESQEGILNKLAEDYVAYLKYKPDAHLILSGHADLRGSPQYNQALTERRVERARSFLVAHGVPEDHIELRPLGQNQQLTSDEVKVQIAQNPDLTEADRQQMLKNLPVMVWANNRRLDISLSTTGQQSTHRYPFNAKDYLTLISTEGTGKKHAAKTRKMPRK